jgi:hypothetical protein
MQQQTAVLIVSILMQVMTVVGVGFGGRAPWMVGDNCTILAIGNSTPPTDASLQTTFKFGDLHG